MIKVKTEEIKVGGTELGEIKCHFCVNHPLCKQVKSNIYNTLESKNCRQYKEIIPDEINATPPVPVIKEKMQRDELIKKIDSFLVESADEQLARLKKGFVDPLTLSKAKLELVYLLALDKITSDKIAGKSVGSVLQTMNRSVELSCTLDGLGKDSFGSSFYKQIIEGMGIINTKKPLISRKKKYLPRKKEE